MKLTKKKLEQLIMEEMSYFRPVEDEGKPKKFPQYADKLSTLAGSGVEGYKQAQELSSALHQDEDYDPIDVPIGLKDMKTMQPHKRNIDELFDNDYELHWNFLLDGWVSSFEEEPDITAVYEFAQERGLDFRETLDSIMKNWKKTLMQKHVRPETPGDKMREIHGISTFGDD